MAEPGGRLKTGCLFTYDYGGADSSRNSRKYPLKQWGLTGGQGACTLAGMTGHAMTRLRLPRALLWCSSRWLRCSSPTSAFRGYLNPEFLFGFANGFTC